MNEQTHIGWKEMQAKLKADQDSLQTLYWQYVDREVASGMQGERLPYLIRADWSITLLLALCLILFSLVLKKGKKYLILHFKGFFLQRRRANLFDEQMAINLQYTFLLGAISCLLFGVAFFDFFMDSNPALIPILPSLWWVGIYTIGCALLFVVKRTLYAFVNAVFFDEEQSKRWVDAFLDVTALTGLVLFPVILFIVYFDVDTEKAVIAVLAVYTITKLMLFYKCLYNFFCLPYGALHLILYFCALELTPDFLLWKGLEWINQLLLTN